MVINNDDRRFEVGVLVVLRVITRCPNPLQKAPGTLPASWIHETLFPVMMQRLLAGNSESGYQRSPRWRSASKYPGGPPPFLVLERDGPGAD